MPLSQIVEVLEFGTVSAPPTVDSKSTNLVSRCELVASLTGLK